MFRLALKLRSSLRLSENFFRRNLLEFSRRKAGDSPLNSREFPATSSLLFSSLRVLSSTGESEVKRRLPPARDNARANCYFLDFVISVSGRTRADLRPPGRVSLLCHPLPSFVITDETHLSRRYIEFEFPEKKRGKDEI